MSIEIKNRVATIGLADTVEKSVKELKELAAAFTEQANKVENELAQLKESVKQEAEPICRADVGEKYYYIAFCAWEGVCVLSAVERPSGVNRHFDKDNERNRMIFNHNNYFRTEAQAQEVADKIKFLLRLEKLHDIHCPGYVPDWDFVSELKYYVGYDIGNGEYNVWVTNDKFLETNVYFPTKEIAEKVCEVLNAKLKK